MAVDSGRIHLPLSREGRHGRLLQDPRVGGRQFLPLLVESPHLEGIFDPWRDVDRENDRGSWAPVGRVYQLSHYLSSRLNQARYLIVGEAVGYQGGHFTGIPMTSERILLGFRRDQRI